ncbi:MAG: hypothetical protein WC980_01340 [Candidatus Brocadiia bacterium]
MNKRPIIIKIILILLIWENLVFVLGLADTFIVHKSWSSFLIPSIILLAYAYIAGLLSLVSTIGVWRAKKWGWWTGALYFIFLVIINISLFIPLPGFIGMFSQSPLGISFYIERVCWGLFSALIFLAFFKDNVLEYFGFQQLPKTKVIAILSLTALLILLILVILMAKFTPYLNRI